MVKIWANELLGKAINKAKIILAGVAYKKDIDDVWESLLLLFCLNI
jgi:UDP-N-acetyl-D-mannosaminuronate dehydrogenase